MERHELRGEAAEREPDRGDPLAVDLAGERALAGLPREHAVDHEPHVAWLVHDVAYVRSARRSVVREGVVDGYHHVAMAREQLRERRILAAHRHESMAVDEQRMRARGAFGVPERRGEPPLG